LKPCCCLSARPEHGVAAVEAGLVTTILMPLMLGVMVYGNWFWHAQRVEPYAAHLPQSAVVGYDLSCAEVVSLVKQAVVDLSSPVGEAYAPALGLDDVSVDVVEVLPDASVVVNIGVRTSVTDTLASWLPDHGDVVTETAMRLENVTVDSSVCS
jgi:hypothetical protein